MQFSTRARYAVRAMVELAANHDQGAMQLKEIAGKQEISEKYLEQIMFPLRNSGLVVTRRGSRGGYHLKKNPSDINLLDIVQTVEGSLAPVACVDNPESCSRISDCVVRNVWVRLGEVVRGELESITLADLALQHISK